MEHAGIFTHYAFRPAGFHANRRLLSNSLLTSVVNVLLLGVHLTA